jgi:hypothetical protein
MAIVNRRFWMAVAAGGLIGGAVVLGFGPLVRSRVDSKAESYGLEVEIDQVAPSWRGVRLRGVGITIVAVPGVRVWLDDVVVGWSGARSLTMSGGRIVAVGALERLVHDAEAWRNKYRSGGSGSGSGGGGRGLSLQGFELDWRSSKSDPARELRARDLELERSAGSLTLSSSSLTAKAGGATVEVEAGRLELQRHEAGYQVRKLSTKSVAFTSKLGAAELKAAGGEETKDESAPPASAASAGSAAPSAATAAAKAGTTAPAVHQRVRAARRLQSLLRRVALRLDGLMADDADVSVQGARAKLFIAGDTLNLGPGTLGVTRATEQLVISLEPDILATGDRKPLTFTMRIPLVQGSDKSAISGELRGGPVWLSMLGVQEGDLGLKNVDQIGIESDVSVVLPPGGQTIVVDGRGKLHDLAISSPRLAAAPLEGIEVAWQAKLEARLDGGRIDIEHGELDLGDIRGMFSGSYERSEAGERVDIGFEMPLVGCQQVFDSLPKALVPRLGGMRFAGTMAAKGHARFDTADLAKRYDVDWVGSMSCRVTEAPPTILARRFTKPFDKLVYTPKGDEQNQRFGPETDDWVPLSSISHFMEGAVLTTEDGRFFRHAGFDQEAIVNSLRENLKAKRFVRGASTISMQLAKNLYLPRTKTISRKLQEAVLTLYLEQELTKREMMELYLNVIEYGPMVYGIGPAAKHYFNTSASNLSLGQSLYLASILANPKVQFFGAGGAVTANRMKYLRTLMKIVQKIGRITDEELSVGLRETVVFGSSSQLAPPEDEDVYDGAKPDPLELPAEP